LGRLGGGAIDMPRTPRGSSRRSQRPSSNSNSPKVEAERAAMQAKIEEELRRLAIDISTTPSDGQAKAESASAAATIGSTSSSRSVAAAAATSDSVHRTNGGSTARVSPVVPLSLLGAAAMQPASDGPEPVAAPAPSSVALWAGAEPDTPPPPAPTPAATTTTPTPTTTSPGLPAVPDVPPPPVPTAPAAVATTQQSEGVTERRAAAASIHADGPLVAGTADGGDGADADATDAAGLAEVTGGCDADHAAAAAAASADLPDHRGDFQQQGIDTVAAAAADRRVRELEVELGLARRQLESQRVELERRGEVYRMSAQDSAAMMAAVVEQAAESSERHEAAIQMLRAQCACACLPASRPLPRCVQRGRGCGRARIVSACWVTGALRGGLITHSRWRWLLCLCCGR
jgi:hypothetical protein